MIARLLKLSLHHRALTLLQMIQDMMIRLERVLPAGSGVSQWKQQHQNNGLDENVRARPRKQKRTCDGRRE